MISPIFFKIRSILLQSHKLSSNITKRPTWKQIMTFKTRILYKMKIHNHGLSPPLRKHPHMFYTPSFTLLYSTKGEMRGTQN